MVFRRLFQFAVFLVLVVAVAWAATALYLDGPLDKLPILLPLVFLVIVAGILIWARPRALGILLCFGLFGVVVAWWLTLKASNDRPWLRDVAQTPWAEIQGNRVVIHNVRNFDYTTEMDYTPHWETRTYDLSKIQSVDLYMNYWGSPAIAHTILSFEFADSPPIAFSIETRKQDGQSYSAFLGFFRQFSLIYIMADERDVVRVRTNYRKGEDLYLYRTRATPAIARGIFLDYLKTANDLRDHPQWYNALTSNCTTDIRPHLMVGGDLHVPWDWRILINGYADQMAYQRGNLVAAGLPFDELKRRAHINPAAKAADQSPDFSRRIRLGRPGFDQTAEKSAATF
jgi:Domain of unknown function (DUF4105)